MPHDRDEKPPAPDATPAFDFNNLPRVRPAFMLTPDDPPGKPAPEKPAPEFDPNILPLVRPAFRVTTGKLGARPTLQKPAPAPPPRKTTGEDWRAQTLAERANKPPARAEEPAGEGQAALRAFLEAGEADAQSETPLADEKELPG